MALAQGQMALCSHACRFLFCLPAAVSHTGGYIPQMHNVSEVAVDTVHSDVEFVSISSSISSSTVDTIPHKTQRSWRSVIRCRDLRWSYHLSFIGFNTPVTDFKSLNGTAHLSPTGDRNRHRASIPSICLVRHRVHFRREAICFGLPVTRIIEYRILLLNAESRKNAGLWSPGCLTELLRYSKFSASIGFFRDFKNNYRKEILPYQDYREAN